MRLSALLLAAGFLLPSSAFAAVHTHRHSSSHPLVRRTASSGSSHSSHFSERPSYGISSERATQIQSALIQRGYLSGEPTGTWDSASISAMQKLQADNNWQTKLVPDSRALIKLGLGPNSTPAAPATSAATSSAPALSGPAAN